MRRFLITSDIETLAHQYADEMEDTARFGKGNSPQVRLGKLACDLRRSSTIVKR